MPAIESAMTAELLANEQLLDDPVQRDSIRKTLSGAEGETSVQSAIAAAYVPDPSDRCRGLPTDRHRITTVWVLNCAQKRLF